MPTIPEKNGLSYNQGRESEEKLKQPWNNYSLFNKFYGSLIAVLKQPFLTSFLTSLDHDR